MKNKSESGYNVDKIFLSDFSIIYLLSNAGQETIWQKLPINWSINKIELLEGKFFSYGFHRAFYFYR